MDRGPEMGFSVPCLSPKGRSAQLKGRERGKVEVVVKILRMDNIFQGSMSVVKSKKSR